MSGRGALEHAGRATSFLIVAVAYVTAVGAAWAVASAVGGDRPVLALGLGYLTSALVIWVWSMAIDNGSMFDAWVERAAAARRGLARRPARGRRAVAADRARAGRRVGLGGAPHQQLGARPGLGHEDWRYLDMYTKGPKPLISLFGVHLFPCSVVFLGSLSMVPALVWGTRSVGVLDGCAVALGLAASVIELVADEQMRRFRRTKQPGESMTSGMWSWSRHPNYFGELCFWWALWLFALAAAPGWWWTVVGPLAMTAMFVFASVPMLDRRSVESRPGFADYAARTSMLVPLPPRKG